MFTTSKSLFQVVSKCSNTKKKRLLIYIQSVRKAYALGESSNIELVQYKTIQLMHLRLGRPILYFQILFCLIVQISN